MNRQKKDYTDFKAELRPSKQPESKIRAGLYVVATPIGNLRDITLRALDVLAAADVVVCEDTRITKRLLNTYNINTSLLAYHDHNADKMRPKIMALLGAGQIVALASDAGTPLISDPGYKLVRMCIEEGHRVCPLPGASAPLAALVGAGLPSDRFLFAGFLPAKKRARCEFLLQQSAAEATLICFESPKRLLSTLADIAEIWPKRQIVVARELTKIFEEFTRGPAREVADHYRENNPPKGEIVLLLAPDKQSDVSQTDMDRLLRNALKSHSLRDAVALVAETTGLPRKQIYKRALDFNS